MRTYVPFLVPVVLALGGCAHSVTTSIYDPCGTNAGVVYSLPKTLLKVSVTYTIEKRTRMVDGLLENPTETPTIRKPIVIEPILTSDPRNSLVLSGEGLTKGVSLDSSFKFQISDSQLLAGVTAETTDKTPEILQGVVTSGISIAKMVAMAGERATTPMKEVANRLKTINDRIAALAAAEDPNNLKRLDALLKEQQVWLSFAAKYRELNTTKVEEREVIFSRILDLTDFKWMTDHWEAKVVSPGARLGDFSDAAVPAVTVEVFATEQEYNNSKAAFSPTGSAAQHQAAAPNAGQNDKMKRPCTAEKGVIYRASVPLRTKVRLGGSNTVVFDDYIPFAQVGPFNKVEARYKALAKRTTTIVFSAATGGVKEYGVEATSSGDAAAKAIDMSLAKMQTALGDIKKAQDAAEATKKTPEQIKLSDLDMQKKLTDAEAALIEAQQKLERLRAGSGSK